MLCQKIRATNASSFDWTRERETANQRMISVPAECQKALEDAGEGDPGAINGGPTTGGATPGGAAVTTLAGGGMYLLTS